MPTPSLRAALGARLVHHSIRLDVDRLERHLLVDRDVLQALFAAAGLTARALVVDLGAGPGTITEAVAPHVHQVVAVELDTRFSPIVDEVRSRHRNVEVVWGDLLQGWPPCNRIVANPPWSTLEALAGRLATRPPAAASLVVSRLFASAATADPEDEAFGRATICVQSTFRVESVAEVPPDAFLPAPRRPAEILALHRHERPLRPGDRHRLAVALAPRGNLRVRDLAARLGRPPTSLPGRNQQRLQHLDRDALASLWAALDPAGE